MNPEIKQKWVSALRSGKYKQIKGELRNREGHCCLGVLCDLIDPEGWTDHDRTIFHRSCCLLPRSDIQDKAGVNGVVHILSTLNDNGNTFSVIADYIERNL